MENSNQVWDGRGDVFFERDIRLWDVAAGIALVLAAGGKFQIFDQTLPDTLTVSADNGVISPLKF